MDTTHVRQLRTAAEECLEKSRGLILNKTINTPNGCGLERFIDIGQGSPGIYGTACGIRILLNCGEPKFSYVIKKYRDQLDFLQDGDGGWSINSIKTRETLTTATCYALNSLAESNLEGESKLIELGIDWLFRNQNEDFGWGLFEGDSISKVVPTAHAILTLSHFPEMLFSEPGMRAIDWLLSARNQEGNWNLNYQESVSMPGVTALSVLALSTRFPLYSPCIKSPINWLANLSFTQTNTEKESFSLHDNEITYHVPTKNLILRALLLSDIFDVDYEKKVLTIVKELTESQDMSGFWIDHSVSSRIPIWATLYATLALNDYIKRVTALESEMQLELINRINERIDDLDKKSSDILEELNSVLSLKDRKSNRWDRSLSSFFSSQAKRFKLAAERMWLYVIAEIFIIVAIYIYIMNPGNPVVNTINLIISIVITIIASVLSNRKQDRPK